MSEADVERTQALRAAVLEQRPAILDVTRFVHRHPALAHEEVQAADRITAALDGLEVERPFAGMATAFRAVVRALGDTEEQLDPRAAAAAEAALLAVTLATASATAVDRLTRTFGQQ